MYIRIYFIQREGKRTYFKSRGINYNQLPFPASFLLLAFNFVLASRNKKKMSTDEGEGKKI